MTNTIYSFTELQKESRMGAQGTETTQREVPVIDLSDFEARRAHPALWR